MDTLFRLVSLQSSDHHHQQQSNSSYNSSRTSNSSRSSKQQHSLYSFHRHRRPPPNNSSSGQEEEDQEECCNNPHQLYMDEDFSSSSNPNPNPNPRNINFSSPHVNIPLNLDFSGRWATDLLVQCARALARHDNSRVQHLMWMLNELSSPYGDTEQKLASYFLQGLFARLNSSGPRTLRSLSSASDRTTSFDSTRRTALRFQELSPWSAFGHVAANGAILEAFLDGSSPQRLQILDLSNTFCTQWPTLLEALATRSADDTPHLTITTVVSSPTASSSAVQRVMKEIGARMEKFARLMGVPFKFNVVHRANDLSTLDLERLCVGGAVLAVNCVNSLHGVSPTGRRRDGLLSAIRRLRPRIVTVVEEEADLAADDEEEGEAFLKGFRESLRFFSAYFESLEESFPKTSNEKLVLERAAGRAVVDLLACPAEESVERRDTATGWSRRLRVAGLEPASFSGDVSDDMRSLLRRYREGWAMRPVDPTALAGIYLTWKEEPVVWASAWRL